MYFITAPIFSPLNPTIQKIMTGKIRIIHKEIITCTESKIKFKIEKIIAHQRRQKIAVE